MRIYLKGWSGDPQTTPWIDTKNIIGAIAADPALARAIADAAERRWSVCDVLAPGAPPVALGHDCYRDGDRGAPRYIKDDNETIIRSKCKVCGAEGDDLLLSCPGKPRITDDPVFRTTPRTDDRIQDDPLFRTPPPAADDMAPEDYDRVRKVSAENAKQLKAHLAKSAVEEIMKDAHLAAAPVLTDVPWHPKQVERADRDVTRQVEFIERRDGPDGLVSVSVTDAVILRDMARYAVEARSAAEDLLGKLKRLETENADLRFRLDGLDK